MKFSWHYFQAVTEDEYPDDVYPTNCFGTFYVISGDIRDRLYKVTRIYWFTYICFTVGIKET